ncbi:LuxR family transcriptional regulator [Rhodococcus erythropolis]|uniref:LuxR C-terminal-related transcriptional regulator n=1 Tax=Rhodococcus erythropolis TaxID=1833 RepID=UPI000995B3EA|nr:LuxR C-terminal-related transcriptional regulator [Rhodococcus erythropolis]MBT1258351.1 LuxR family transcriptional regulator [Rhodococcus erythropolis]
MSDSYGALTPARFLVSSADAVSLPLNPVSMANLVHRERLHTRLTNATVIDPDTHGKVVVVSAPAGAGKTSLLAEWVNTLDTAHAWIDLVEHENNSILLCQTLHHAVADAYEFDIDLPPPRPSTVVETYIEQLCAAIAATGRDLVLVLDDVHHLHDGLALAALDQLLAHAPPSLSIIMAARYEPPLTLHTVALESRLTRLEAVDLAFDLHEIRSLVEQYDIDIEPEHLALIEQTTQGWGALIRLAAQYIAERDDLPQALHEFTHTPRPVSDFLVGEVLAALSGRVQNFLKSTSVVDSFHAELADTLVGGTDASAQLDTLLRRNFPLIHRHDEYHTTWYSYHPLLREHLRAEMYRTDKDTYLHLHLRAAAWYESHHLDLAAFDHVLDTPDGNIEEFLERRGLGIILDGHGQEFVGKLERSPTEVAESTVVKLLHAAEALSTGEPTAAAVYLEFAEQAALLDSDHRALLVALKLEMTRTLDDPTYRTLSTRLTELPPTGHPDIDAYSHLQLGSTLSYEGVFDEAQVEFRRAIAAAQLRSRNLLILDAVGRLAITAGLDGDLEAMRRYGASGLDYAASHHLTESPELALSAAASILSTYLSGQEISSPLSAIDGCTDYTGAPYDAQALIVFELYRFDAAGEDRRTHAAQMRHATAEVIAHHTWEPFTEALVPLVVNAFLEIGEVDWAKKLVSDVLARHGASGGAHLARASIHLAIGNLTQARKDLLAAQSANSPSLAHPIYRAVLETCIELVAGNRNQGLSALSTALSMAAPGRTIRPFLGYAEILRPAFDTFSGHFGDLDDFARQLRELLTAHEPPPALLTRSEQKVLQQLISGDTTETIAAGLFVSVNTVKTHLRGIYRKFDVNTRRDAVRVGRRYGLV